MSSPGFQLINTMIMNESINREYRLIAEREAAERAARAEALNQRYSSPCTDAPSRKYLSPEEVEKAKERRRVEKEKARYEENRLSDENLMNTLLNDYPQSDVLSGDDRTALSIQAAAKILDQFLNRVGSDEFSWEDKLQVGVNGTSLTYYQVCEIVVMEIGPDKELHLLCPFWTMTARKFAIQGGGTMPTKYGPCDFEAAVYLAVEGRLAMYPVRRGRTPAAWPFLKGSWCMDEVYYDANDEIWKLAKLLVIYKTKTTLLDDQVKIHCCNKNYFDALESLMQTPSGRKFLSAKSDAIFWVHMGRSCSQIDSGCPPCVPITEPPYQMGTLTMLRVAIMLDPKNLEAKKLISFRKKHPRVDYPYRHPKCPQFSLYNPPRRMEPADLIALDSMDTAKANAIEKFIHSRGAPSYHGWLCFASEGEYTCTVQ